jgi:hypothetical protein
MQLTLPVGDTNPVNSYTSRSIGCGPGVCVDADACAVEGIDVASAG